MISVMTAKWVGDAFGKDGIYSVWIAMRKYPWLPPVDYRDRGETAAQVMTPIERLIVIEDGCTLRELGMQGLYNSGELRMLSLTSQMIWQRGTISMVFQWSGIRSWLDMLPGIS